MPEKSRTVLVVNEIHRYPGKGLNLAVIVGRAAKNLKNPEIFGPIRIICNLPAPMNDKAVEEQKSSPLESGGQAAKEYQTLFWVPMLFQTAKNAETLIDEMLDMIQDFHDQDQTTHVIRKSITKKSAAPKRRQQILGEVLDSEVVTTRVDVVLKSDNTKYNLLSVLKRHFLFSQLRDYELEDVIDVMQAIYVEEGEVIIQEGDPGELFYILEEGKANVRNP